MFSLRLYRITVLSFSFDCPRFILSGSTTSLGAPLRRKLLFDPPRRYFPSPFSVPAKVAV